MKSKHLWDTLAVNHKTDKVRMLGERKDKPNAEAIMNMAIMRRGCDEEFYVVVPAGLFHEGDTYGPVED